MLVSVICTRCAFAEPPTPKVSLNSLAAAASGARLNTGSLSDRYGGLVVDGRRTHTFLDLSGHGQESLLNVGGALCRSLQEGYAKAVCEFLTWISATVTNA